MQLFAYTRVTNQQAAIAAVNNEATAKFLAGGTNVVDLMKEGVEAPARLVDINRLPLAQITELENGDLRLGALARNSATANHELVRTRYPLVTQTILAGASAQLRNAASNGGNLLQRTRCQYFYDVCQPCNKREPGTGCGALNGFNRIHAILGWSEKCIATYPGDMANALYALDAQIQVAGEAGARTIAATDFHRLPGDAPEFDNNLKRDELITAIDLPASSTKFAAHSYYLKIRERASYAFALVAVAAAVDVDADNRIKDARIVLGSVAHKPWRAAEAEQSLIGKTIETAAFEQAGTLALAGAQGFEYNRYKIEMSKRAVARALKVAAAGGRQTI